MEGHNGMKLQAVDAKEATESPEHVHIYMPSRLRKRLKDFAKGERRSESQTACILIEERLDAVAPGDDAGAA